MPLANRSGVTTLLATWASSLRDLTPVATLLGERGTARPQRAVEESDDLAIQHQVERVAIEAVRISRAVAGDELQCRRKAGDEREVPGTLDDNALDVRQRLRQAFGVILHTRQVVFLAAIDEHGNGDLREAIVGKARRGWRHHHDGSYPRIAELGNLADLAVGFSSSSTTGGAEPGVVGMLAAMRS